MKILHCIPTLGGGGAERQLTYLARALSALGVEIHVAYVSGGPNLSRIQDSTVTLHCLRSLGNHDPRLLFRLLAVVREIQPDIIQTWIPQMDILGGVASRLLGVPQVLTERCSTEAYGSSWKDATRRYLGRQAAVVVANSEYGRSYWTRVRPNRMTMVIRNGVPVGEIVAARPKRTGFKDIARSSGVILAAGRFTAQKNFCILLDALEEVLAQVSEAVAVLCGEGPMHNEIVERVLTHRFSDRIRVLGFAKDLWGLLHEAAVFVSPSLFEGSPNTVLESMAALCPLVVSDIPPHREILEEESALFVDPTNPRLIAEAICSVLQNPEAAMRRTVLAAHRVAEFSVEESAGQYLQLYRSIVECGQGPACERTHETRRTRVV